MVYFLIRLFDLVFMLETESPVKSLLEENDFLKKQIQILEKTNIKINEQVSKSNNRILSLEKMILELRRNLFGRKSEKIDPLELIMGTLFDESEYGLKDEETLLEGHSEILELTSVKSYQRKKTGKKPLPENLPRKEIIHDIEEHEKTCDCGACLVKIGEETSEKLTIIPQVVYVEKHIHFKYACKNCEGDERTEAGKIVLTAKNQNEFYKGSILTPEMFGYTLTSKYVDHIPYYRLSKVFLRFGLEIARATFCNWTIGIYETYKDKFSFLKEILLSTSVLGIDETSLQVLNEKERPNTSKSYMWLLRGGPPDTPILKYIYRETRSAEFLVKYLHGYEGIIQTDGFSSYDSHLTNDSIIHAGCLAHARRKFESEWKSNKNPFAGEILNLIRKVYSIERQINELNYFQNNNFEEIKKIRQEKSKPIMEEIYSKLTEHKLKKNISIGVGNAVNYSLNQWNKLTVFLEHGDCKIDNNLVENGIRPFVLGRKNWLFSGSPNGAEASAFWYSIIETAKANKQEPYKFLLHILKALPSIQNQSDMKDIFLKALCGVY